MGIYNHYNTTYGQIMIRCTLIVVAFLLLTKGCAHVDLIDPGMAVEAIERDMAKQWKDVPREARPYCRLLDEKEDREAKDREEKEFEESGYNFEYDVVAGIFSFFLAE